MNRDELRNRARAQPPREIDGIVAPEDADAGGTWTAANHSGLMGFLLNRTEEGDDATDRPESRGIILPSLLRAVDLEAASHLWNEIPIRMMKPFYCLLRDTKEQRLFMYNGRTLSSQIVPFEEPFFMTTSGLGDELVQSYRQNRFREFLRLSHRSVEEQRRLHHDQNSESPWQNILMTREEARTVSQTFWTLHSDGTLLCEYRDVDKPDMQTLRLQSGDRHAS